MLLGTEKKYPMFFAAQSVDRENVMQSSSGGVFYELCRAVAAQQGIIYGVAAVSPLHVKHIRAENLSHATAFRRSKYMQSLSNGCFGQVKTDLEHGKRVLFSGVGCQIAGLLQYLDVQYENLLTCEVVCHGMPMNEAMEKYIAEKETAYGDKLISVNFRDKSYGWKQNCIAEHYESGRCDLLPSSEHPVHSLYLKGINMRSGCSICKYARLPRVADITLADFWQYEGKINHGDRGVSLVSLNTEKGRIIFEKIKENVNWERTTEKKALISCRHMANAPSGHRSNEAFRKLLKENGFSKAYNLCSNFGEVIDSEKLHKMEEPSESQIFDVFEEDTQEIIYILDKQKSVKGIITFGSFLSAYAEGNSWINENFHSVSLENNSINKIKEIFSQNEKINRIPILDGKKRILYEVRRYTGVNGKNDNRKLLIPFVKLKRCNNECYFVKRPDLLSDMKLYKEKEVRRIQNRASFPVMQANWDKYREDFEDIYGKSVRKDYIDALCKIPQITMRGNRYIHVDGCSRYVNIIGGIRITVDQPEDYEFTIHMYGRCGIFGYAVEDGDTIPSALQAIMNEYGKKIRVENHGLWGADDEKIIKNISLDLEEGVIFPKDIVIVYMADLSCMDELKRLSVKYYDTTIPFHKFLKSGATFFDKPGHMNAEGYTFIAQYLYQKLEEINSLSHCSHQLRNGEGGKKPTQNRMDIDNIDVELKRYLEETRKMLPVKELETNTVGAIVMNCNPFTCGHRYLIEEALKNVEILILFVLEENKSYFSFEDRIRMVKLGTVDLKNVFVVPSGKFIISALTFPEYFLKEHQPNIVIQTADDVSLFGKYIAPALHIKKRFVGTEPTDKVTAQYNEQLKKILPLYGMELYEIPRLKQENSYVTATEVRRCIESHDYLRIESLVPFSTLQYLKEVWK